MSKSEARERDLATRLAEAEATIQALLSGQIDAVVDSRTSNPVLLAKAQDALRASEERYRRIIETTKEGVWQTDERGQTTFMNGRMAEMLGCEADLGAGASTFDFLDPGEAVRLVSYQQRPSAGQVELRMNRRDGTSVWTLYRAVPVHGRSGLPEGTLAMVTDISERRHAEEAQRVSAAALLESDRAAERAIRHERDRAQRYLDTAEVFLVALDTEGRITLVNRYACSVLGWSSEELLGERWADRCVAPAHRAEMSRRFEVKIGGGGPPTSEHAILTRSGEERIIEWRNTVQYDAAGAIAGTFSSGTDVTERTRAVEALRTAEERMRFALTSSNIGLWDLDGASRRLEFSAIQEAQYGMAAGSFDGTLESYIQAIHPDDRASAGDELTTAMRRGGDFALEYRALWPDGSVRWLRVAGRIVLDAHGSPQRAVGITQDVTERHTLEQQYLQSQKMEAVGRLAGGIAHDFNNLLSVILTCGEFLIEGLGALDPARKEADEICKAGRRAADLTRQLLMFSRQQVLAPRVIDLAALTASMEGMLRRVVGEDVELRFEHGTEPAHVRADPGSIEQVIMNLVVNARDAMPTGGVLTVGTRVDWVDADYQRRTFAGAVLGRHVVLTVTDTGTGIDAVTQARIFEPFYTTKAVGQGTGLGLSTVFGIVQQSAGAIRLQSVVGTGSTFCVYLPHVADHAAEEPIREGPSAAARGTETILLVEDEEQVRMVARMILTRHGYTVIDKGSAADALLFCRHGGERIDLLLTDVVMPHMSGPELGRLVQEIQPHVRLLCMSGYTDDSVVRHGVLEGVTAFLQKPFTSASLTQKVREVLQERLAS